MNKNWIIYVCGIFILIFLISTSVSAIPPKEWENNYYSKDKESGVCIDQTNDNSFIIAGSRTDENRNNYVVVIKTNSFGNKLWSKTFGEGAAKKILSTSDNGCILLVIKMVSGSQITFESRLIKLSSDGSKEWEKIYKNDNVDCFNDVTISNDGDYVMVGSKMKGIIDSDVWLMKVSKNSGSKIWEKSFDNSGSILTASDSGYAIDNLINGGYIISASTMKIDINTNGELWLIKTDDNGNLVNSKTFGESYRYSMYYGNSIQEDYNCNIIVAGSRNKVSDIYSTYYYMLKTNSNLDKIKTYQKLNGEEENEMFYSSYPTADGGYIAVGAGVSTSNGFSAYTRLFKFDSNLNEQWHQDYGKNDDTRMISWAKQTKDGGYIVTGGKEGNITLLKFKGSNSKPNDPDVPKGATSLKKDTSYTYTFTATDPDGHKIKYVIDWGNDETIIGYFNPGAEASATHSWSGKGTYNIKVKVVDVLGLESDWSDSLTVNVKGNGKATSLIKPRIFQQILKKVPLLEKLFSYFFILS